MSTHLYRHYDANGTLLYVGISKNAVYRFQAHKKSSAWARGSVRMTIEMFPDRLSASIAELEAIKCEKPLHNVGHLDRLSPVGKCPKPLSRPRREEETVMVSARLMFSTVGAMNTFCESEDVSRSQLIEDAVRKFLTMKHP